MRHRALQLLLVVALPLLSWGCTPVADQGLRDPLAFTTLDLERLTPEGELLWRLSSPTVSHDVLRGYSSARNPVAELFDRDGRRTYRITAERAQMFGDASDLQLEGNVAIQSSHSDPIAVWGERLHWDLRRGSLHIDQSPRAENGAVRLTGGEAFIDLGTNTLRMTRGFLLHRLVGRAEPGADGGRQQLSDSPMPAASQLVLEGKTLAWEMGNGPFHGEGPTRVSQRSGGTERFLSSPAFSGHSIEQWIDFSPPVVLDDPADDIVINTGKSRWWIDEGRISSDAPLEGRRGLLRIRGAAMEVRLPQKTLLIQGSCQLDQPGETLQADFCRWDYGKDHIHASGHVTLRRAQGRQTTTADVLDGVIDSNGLMRFGGPDGGVQTTIEFSEPRRQRRDPHTPIVF